MNRLLDHLPLLTKPTLRGLAQQLDGLRRALPADSADAKHLAVMAAIVRDAAEPTN